MSRAQLRSLGIDLPLFPTTSVGSFPKPEPLKRARSRFDKGKIDRAELDSIETEATLFWIRTQEELGIDVLVDGEMYRGDMVAYFAETMDGFAQSGLVRSYGNRYYRKPIIVGPVRWKGPMTVARWAFAQRQTKRPVKGMLTGPYTIMDWSFDEHYPDRRACALALARELRREVEALVAAGCRIIQIDEPALSVRPEELPVAYEAVRIVTEDLPAYFINHVCYGEFDRIYPDMLRMPVHNLDLEMSNSGLDLLERFRRTPFTKDISFGLTDVHTHRVPEAAVVRERLARAAQVIPPEQIWADPDCGLKTRTVDEAIGHLKVIVEAARSLRRG
jgi:5-methyltetrahydropteroyltriglutamate--homocysteine methyltransferase